MLTKVALGAFVSTPVMTRPAVRVLHSLNTTHAVIMLMVVSTLVHLIASGAVGLGNDEAYTVANARIVSLSYVDYPPLHVWLVGAWAAFAHSEAPLVVRIPFMAFFAGSTWLMYALTAFLFGRRAGFWAALIFNIAPVYAIAHGSWVLPDGPLSFFMLAVTFVTARQLFGEKPFTHELRPWLFAGVLTGLALLTKYHAAFLIAGTFVFLLTWPPGRIVLRTPGPWLAVGVALVIFSPVLIWNNDHGWSGLFFQSARLTNRTNLSAMRVLANIGGQAVYLSPWLFVPLALVLCQALSKGPPVQRTWFLALLACGPILFFNGASFIAKGLPHWPMPGWLFAFPLLGQRLSDWERIRPRAVHGFALLSVGLTACLLLLFIGEARFGWITGDATTRSAEHNPTLDLLDWHSVGMAVKERHLIDAATPAIAGTSWMTAGKLNYTIGTSVPVLCLCADPQQFRYLHDPGGFIGRDIIVVQTPWQYAHDGAALRQSFERMELLPPVVLERNGTSALKLIMLRGKHLLPLPANERRA